MAPTMVKETARALVESLPDSATWDDLMHAIYVRGVIERGMDDARDGRIATVRDVRTRYGLPE